MNWWETVDWQDPINRDCPLNAGIVGWWMGAPGLFGGTRLWDLCNKNHGTLTNMNPATAWRNSVRGLGLSIPNSVGGAGVLATPSPPTSAFTLAVAWTPGFTIHLNTYRLIAGWSNTAFNGTGIWARNDSGVGRIDFGVGTQTTAVGGALVMEPQTLSMSAVSGVRVHGYKDGSRVATRSTGGAAFPSLGSFNFSVGCLSTPGSNTGAYGLYQCVVLSHLEWGDTQHAFFNDQYRRGFPDLLNHDRRRTIFLPPVDAAFNPAWAIGSNIVLSPGAI